MFVQREDNIIKETIEGMEKFLLRDFLWIKRPMQFLFLWPLQNKSGNCRGSPVAYGGKLLNPALMSMIELFRQSALCLY
ncbi:unnamed protein product [Trichogramma brassicae]|uniref:Uncharacterized protein n=1 Tax=Trichogramma brassicae TaxID=86971 RepID=A0A6H5I140_9HYME|nr:unnamed protein product [Trichogramma brassicae]